MRVLLALALLCQGVSACFNPYHVGVPVDVENHVPLVDVVPTATLRPIPAAVTIDGGAQACAPTEFNFVDLFDADGDELTVLWTIVFARSNELRRVLKESPAIVPLDDGSYAVNDSTDLTLDAAVLERALGADLALQAEAGPDVFQLIELRVSDNGFSGGNDPVPVGGGAMFYKSWNVKLEPCAAVAP
ncbi:MAG TPA: hypothetical protein VGF99_00220 [Myxococcota bacterium]